MAKANNVDLKIVIADTTKPSVEHLKANGLGKIPAFLGEDGYALSECIAIAIYSTWAPCSFTLGLAFCRTPLRDEQALLNTVIPV